MKVKYCFKSVFAGIFLSVLLAATNKQAQKDPIPVGTYALVYPAGFGNKINTDPANPVTKEGAYLGRMLFYDTRLSLNNKISCASCHQQKLAFTDGRKFSRGVGKHLTSRNSMSLANLLWVRSFFWDGRAKSLEVQGKFPIEHPDEMGETVENIARKLQRTTLYPPIFKSVFGSGNISGERIIKAISQFERTLISANSRYDQYLQGNYEPTEKEMKGISLFFSNPSMENKARGANCGHCHQGPKMFSDQFHNNGLDSLPADIGREKFTGLLNDKGRFRAVSLRNIALTAPYMHDGRFNTLEEVLEHYSAHIRQSATLSPFIEGGIKLTNNEKQEIIAFLQMLTDSSFINNPLFSNPHKQ